MTLLLQITGRIENPTYPINKRCYLLGGRSIRLNTLEWQIPDGLKLVSCTLQA